MARHHAGRVALCLAMLLPGAAGAQTLPAPIAVISPTLKTGEAMPRDYTPDGRNVSPPIAWSDRPADIAGATQGLNSWRRAIDRGPAPPPGTTHIYYFTVHALDADLDLKPHLTRAQLLDAIQGHIIGGGETVPVYQRRPAPSGQ